MDKEEFEAKYPRKVDNPFARDPNPTTKQWLDENKTTITGYHKPTVIPMPVSQLIKMPGRKDEHLHIQPNDARVNQLANNMKEHGYDPNESITMEYDHEGKPWLYEGNHRARAAHQAGIEFAPTQVRYLGGGEQFAHAFDEHVAHVKENGTTVPCFGKDCNNVLSKYKHGNPEFCPTCSKNPDLQIDPEKYKAMGRKAAQNLEPYRYKVTKNKTWLEQHPGRQTGSHGDNLLRLPVAWLKTLPGLRGEHKKLHMDMPKVKGMAKVISDKKWQREHPVELGVQHDGKVCVDDGNHRIRAAQVAGVESLLCKVKYYGGGEQELDIAGIVQKHAIWENNTMKLTISHVKALMKLVKEGKLSENDMDLLDEADFGPGGAEEAAHHLSTNFGKDCLDENCPIHMPNVVAPKLSKAADSQSVGTSGDADGFGEQNDGEYSDMESRGENVAGDNDSNKDDEPIGIRGNNGPMTDGRTASHPFANRLRIKEEKKSKNQCSHCTRPPTGKGLFCDTHQKMSDEGTLPKRQPTVDYDKPYVPRKPRTEAALGKAALNLAAEGIDVSDVLIQEAGGGIRKEIAYRHMLPESHDIQQMKIRDNLAGAIKAKILAKNKAKLPTPPPEATSTPPPAPDSGPNHPSVNKAATLAVLLKTAEKLAAEGIDVSDELIKIAAVSHEMGDPNVSQRRFFELLHSTPQYGVPPTSNTDLSKMSDAPGSYVEYTNQKNKLPPPPAYTQPPDPHKPVLFPGMPGFDEAMQQFDVRTKPGLAALLNAAENLAVEGIDTSDIIMHLAKEHMFTDKEHRQHDHIKESEEASGKSEEEADDIAWATTNKLKHKAESNLPCPTCGSNKSPCDCLGGSSMTPYTVPTNGLGGKQRKNTAPHTVKKQKEFDPGSIGNPAKF